MPRRRLRLAAIVLSVAVATAALTGCAAGEAVADPTPTAPSVSATPPTTASPTPTPTPTPSASMDPADPAMWLITTTSIGPAELGSPEEAFFAALAPSFIPVSHCEGLTSLDAVDPTLGIGMWSSYGGDPSGARFSVRAMSLFADPAASEPMAASPRTASGIRLGSSLDELRAAHPQLEEWVDPRPGGDQKLVTEYTVADDAGHLIFAVRDDHVDAITATLDLPPVGFCS